MQKGTILDRVQVRNYLGKLLLRFGRFEVLTVMSAVSGPGYYVCVIDMDDWTTIPVAWTHQDWTV